MPRLTCGCLAVVAIVALAATSVMSSEISESNRYHDKVAGFSLGLPPGWIGVPRKGEEVLAVPSPRRQENGLPEAVVSVRITKSAPEANLDAFYDREVAALEKERPDVKKPDTGPIRIDGENGKYLVFSYTENGVAIKGVSVFLTGGPKEFLITCTTLAPAYGVYESTFEKITQSFQFLPRGAARSATTTYANAVYGFSVAFPSNWTISEPGKDTAVSATSPLEDNKDRFAERVDIIVREQPVTVDLDRTVKSIVDALEKESDARIIETESVALGGRSAKRVVYTATFGADRLKNTAYIAQAGSLRYVITCSCAEDEFEKRKPVFDAVMESFRFDGGAGDKQGAKSPKSSK